MAKIVLYVNGGDGDTYVISGDKHANCERLSTLFKTLASGAKTTTYTVDSHTSAVVATAAVTPTSVSVNDTITLNGTAITAKQINATGTVTFSSLANNDTVTVNGQLFTAKTTVTDATVQFALGASDTAAAANLVTVVNASTLSLVFRQFTATSAAGVVTFRAYTGGTAGNSMTLVSSNAGRALTSGATLTNGIAIANNQFDQTGTDTQTAADIVRCVLASTTDLISKVLTASSSAAIVTFSALVAGYAGNANTIATSNGTRLPITGGVSRLASGADTLISMNF